MTRHGKKTRVSVILMSVLQIISLISAYYLHKLTRAKLGLLRHLVYLNGKWEKAVNIEMIKYSFIAFAAAVIIFAVLRKRSSLAGKVLISVSALVFSGYLLFFSKSMDRAYYAISLVLAAGFILETLVWLITDRK